MGRLIALDSTVVIMMIGGASAADDAEQRARNLLEVHRAAGDRVAIPAAVVAECFHCAEEDLRQLTVLPLNAAAAVLANRITPAAIAGAKKCEGKTRRSAKVDCLILATAEVHRVDILYTTDDWFRKDRGA